MTREARGIDRPLRVLAIAEDLRGLVTACRVHAPLMTLKRQGLVSEYWVTDSTMSGVPDEFAFDVLWVQRAPEPRLSHRLVTRFQGQYLHDLDDLLVSEPRYVPSGEFPDRDSLVAIIEHSAVFTVPTERLARLVTKHTGLVFGERCLVCPNAIELPAQPPRVPAPPVGLILAQSHRLALTESREAVLGALREFAAGTGLPLYYFGPPPEVLGDGVSKLLGPTIGCGYVGFWQYHSLLAAWPSMIGVAPLETAGDAATLDFVAGKSDVKMVEFGGFGHPTVYSRAVPFVDTDLEAGVLTENTRQGWLAALSEIREDGWRKAPEEQSAVAATRALEKVARENWREALLRARLPEPRRARELIASRRGWRVLRRVRRAVGGGA